jgi:hypothetical protein
LKVKSYYYNKLYENVHELDCNCSECYIDEFVRSRMELNWINIRELFNIIRKLKFKVDRKSLEHMYFSYVRPILEYADVIWDNCPNYIKEKLEHIFLMGTLLK